MLAGKLEWKVAVGETLNPTLELVLVVLAGPEWMGTSWVGDMIANVVGTSLRRGRRDCQL